MQKYFEIFKVALTLILFAAVSPISAFYAKVQTPDGTPIAGAAVTFSFFDTTAYSDANGVVSFTHISAIIPGNKATMPASLRMSNRNISVYMPANGKVDLRVYTLSGRQVFVTSSVFTSGLHTMRLPIMAKGIYILRAVVGGNSFVRKVNSTTVCQWQEASRGIGAIGKLSKRTMTGDTAFFAKTGYNTVRRPFACYGDDLGNVVMDSILIQGPVKAVSAGFYYTMILQNDNTLWATGDNDYGQHGDGTFNSKSTPVQVMRGVLIVSAGRWHTMVLKQDSTLWAMGYNHYGQLGVGDTIDKPNPVQIMSGVLAVSAGQNHTMILKHDGTLWATGYNIFGQLGDGTVANRSDTVLVMSGVSAVSAGYNHTMILKQDNTLWATGQNYYGQLGDGTFFEKHTPVQIMSGVLAVSAGYNHTMIIKQDGTLWATGDNYYGQLGIGNKTEKSTPVQVMSGVLAVSAGYNRTMILKQDNTFWGTGDNYYGQLGAGDTIAKSTPVQVMIGVLAVSMGYNHVMILKQNGTLWATGENSLYQLGIVTTTYNISTPEQVLPPQYNGLTVSGGTGSGSYLSGVNVTGTAFDSSAAHRKFDHWRGPDSIWVSNQSSTNSPTFTFAMPNKALLIAAVYRDLHSLTVTSGSGSGWFDSSAKVTITAIDSTAAKRGFDHWGGADSALISCGVCMTTSFIMPPRAVTIKAVYSGLFTLTVNGGSGSGSYFVGTTLTIRAIDSTAAQRGFSHWGGPDSASVWYNLQEASDFTMPNRAATINAVYGDLHTLTINEGNGSGRSYIPQCIVSIYANDSTATHRGFDHWGGPDSILVLNDTSKTTTFTMPDRAATVTAIFRDMNVLTVTNGTGSGWYDKGQAASITANDSTSAHKAFDHWGGADSALVANDTNKTTTFTMPNRAASVMAVHRDMYVLALTNGTVSGWYDRGQKITIVANDSTTAKRVFDHWGGVDSVLVSNDTTKTTIFVMPGRNAFLTAIYSAGCIVTYDKNNGDVDASPKQSPLIASGRRILFSPTPPSHSGYCFAGWNLNADGTGEEFFNTSIVMTDITVYAQWTKVFSAVSAGNGHTMVIGQNGALLAMGLNRYGQLGDWTTVDKSTPILVMTGVSAVSAGGWHTMVLKQDGTLWAMGSNGYGQLGDGTKNDKSTPILVMTGVLAVSAGSMHTMILKQDNSLWATGDNNYGQLGDGTKNNKSTPILVMTGVLAVSAGQNHTMILKQDGTLWATGYNRFGQLGTGDTINKSTPVQVMTGVLAVSAGSGHTMILKQDNSLWAMGSNTDGQFGDWTITSRTTPVQVMTGVLTVSAGDRHTMILKQDNTLWATGYNYKGQLGDKTTIDKYIPVHIMSGVSAVSAGSYYTIILKQDGTVWATGENYYGQLGDGTTINKSTPIQVMPLP